MRTLKQVGLWLSSRALIAIGLVVAQSPHAHAITINMEYTDEGDPVPHDENPSWDPAGVILKAHFQAAKQIWESLLPGEGEIDFDFHWDDDIDGLGLYSSGLDDYIEISPLWNWFADPTLNDSGEFAAPVQTLYSQISPVLQSSHFPATAPPGALEVGYRGAGFANGTLVNGVPVNTVSASGQIIPGTNPTQVDASNGYDLLSTVVHEIGHALGLSGIEPGNYNILPEHVGGLAGVEVLEGGGGHLAGQGNVPYLMCENCGAPGVRRFPTATDILVIAEELGVSNVHLARVGRISSGDWSNTNAWIGADVPDETQDVYVTQGGPVLIDLEVANVKSLLVNGGSTVDAQTADLSSAGVINFSGGALAVGIGGSITAQKFEGDPANLTTTAFSLVRFNEFTPDSVLTTEVPFNGSVAIGLGTPDLVPVTFNSHAVADWNIAQNLSVGDQRNTTLVIDNSTWNVGGNLIVRGAKGEVAYYPSTVTVESSGTLNVTGVVDIGFQGEVEYKSGKTASNTTYEVRGGTTSIVVPPPPSPPQPFLDHTPAGLLMFEGNANAATATINVEGGVGEGGPGGVVIFRDDGSPSPDAHAADAEFWVKAGVGGVSLRISGPTVIAGTGGRVQFRDSTSASTAHFRNDGVSDHGGSGGGTHFSGDSTASDAVFDNYGSTLASFHSGTAFGGRTEFFENSKAANADFNNHPGAGMGSLGAGITIFRGSSNADTSAATFNNKGGVPGTPFGGATEFYDQASAGSAIFHNEIANGVTLNSLTAGNVRFYGSSTAANATFHNKRGGGSTFFNNSSTAGDAHFFIENTGVGFEGYVGFFGSSNAGTADITVRPLCFGCGVLFHDTSNADHAEIKLDDNSQAGVRFWHGASMGHANIEIGSGGGLDVRNSATAANATIRFKAGGSGTFLGALATAADANITLDGGAVSGGGGASLFFSGGNAGNSTINVNGGTVSGAGGAQVHFGSGANAGTATVIAGSGVAGAAGGGINLGGGTIASNARFTVGAGGFVSLPSGGPIEVGSMEGAGTIQLGHNELRAGALNTSTTISGPIIGFVTNPRLTKIGTGTLTLTGANTYIGLTKVDGGTLVINGSTPGSVEVNNGATLKGIGTIGGTVTVNSGTFAPGNTAGGAPNMITVGGLAMMSGGILDFELGPSTYDRIVASGNVALAGILNLSLVDGFSPAVGNTFNLLDWSTVGGIFATINLPALAAGLNWNTSQLYSTGVLSVASTGVPGDFNNDGKVDGADYVVWRKNDGSPAGYNLWRSNFGQTAGSGSSTVANAAVPEPSTLVMLVLAVAGVCSRRCQAA